MARELDLERVPSGRPDEALSFGENVELDPSSPAWGMPMPESLGGYCACGAALEERLTGGFGAGRLGMRLI